MKLGYLHGRMRRVALAAIALALLVVGVVVVGDSRADLDTAAQSGSGGVFTSRTARLRLLVPRGWRATEQPNYPGLLLWMLRNQPSGQMVLSSETFTRELYCSWPVTCRATHDSPTAKYACALRQKLEAQRLRVGTVQAGPKENEAAGMPSVWFEYDDGRRFLRQAIAMTGDRAISLILSAPSNDARAAHGRAFEQVLRSLSLLPEAVIPVASAPGSAAAAAPAGDGGVATAPADAQPDAALVIDGGVEFQPAPAPTISPIGPCDK